MINYFCPALKPFTYKITKQNLQFFSLFLYSALKFKYKRKRNVQVQSGDRQWEERRDELNSRTPEVSSVHVSVCWSVCVCSFPLLTTASLLWLQGPPKSTSYFLTSVHMHHQLNLTFVPSTFTDLHPVVHECWSWVGPRFTQKPKPNTQSTSSCFKRTGRSAVKPVQRSTRRFISVQFVVSLQISFLKHSSEKHQMKLKQSRITENKELSFTHLVI